MPVGTYTERVICEHVLPSFNLHLLLLIQRVLSGWDYGGRMGMLKSWQRHQPHHTPTAGSAP